MPKQDSEKLITREEFEKVKKLLEARATKLDKRLEELQENFRKGIKISGEEYKNVLSAIRKLEQEFEVFKIDFVKFYDEFGSIVGRIKRVEHNTGVTSQNTNQLIAHVVNLDERQDKMEADISQIKKELKQIRDEKTNTTGIH
jgi:phage shock protein A